MWHTPESIKYCVHNVRVLPKIKKVFKVEQVSERGYGRLCDHINHSGYHIKEIWILKHGGLLTCIIFRGRTLLIHAVTLETRTLAWPWPPLGWWSPVGTSPVDGWCDGRECPQRCHSPCPRQSPWSGEPSWDQYQEEKSSVVVWCTCVYYRMSW